MARLSAGLLLYRRPATRADERAPADDAVEVLLVHPGGPFWARRDDGAWSIPKGELDQGEDPLAAAEREVTEELGMPVPPGPRRDLGEIVQRGGKRVHAWAVEGDVDPATVQGNHFELEWPPRSGRVQSFPEVDRAAWFTLSSARRKILPAQTELLDRLAALGGTASPGTAVPRRGPGETGGPSPTM